MDLKTLDFSAKLLAEQFVIENKEGIKEAKAIVDLTVLAIKFREFISKFNSASEISAIAESKITESSFANESSNEKRYKALKNQRNENVQRFALWAQFRYLVSIELTKQNFISTEELTKQHDYKSIYNRYSNLPFDYETFVMMTNDTEKSNSFILSLLPKSDKIKKSEGTEKQLLNEKFRVLDSVFPSFAPALLEEFTKAGGTQSKGYTFTFAWSVNFQDSFIESQKAFETVYLDSIAEPKAEPKAVNLSVK